MSFTCNSFHLFVIFIIYYGIKIIFFVGLHLDNFIYVFSFHTKDRSCKTSNLFDLSFNIYEILLFYQKDDYFRNNTCIENFIFVKNFDLEVELSLFCTTQTLSERI